MDPESWKVGPRSWKLSCYPHAIYLGRQEKNVTKNIQIGSGNIQELEMGGGGVATYAGWVRVNFSNRVLYTHWYYSGLQYIVTRHSPSASLRSEFTADLSFLFCNCFISAYLPIMNNSYRLSIAKH